MIKDVRGMYKGKRRRSLMIAEPSGSKYIGACSCGFEPYSYYTTPKGTIVHASQVFRPFKDLIVDLTEEQDVKEVK